MKKFLAVVVIATFPLLARAQDSSYLEGAGAHENREYEKAMKLLTPYAEQGDCFAQYAVGFAYWNDKANPVKDSIAEVYLTKAAEQKQTHAMGILATILILRSFDNPGIRPTALMWAELAAMYDPIQQATTTRSMIRKYLEAFEISKAE